MARRKPTQPDPGWTERDSILVHTLMIVHATIEDRLHERPFLASRFALAYPDERLVASGAYDLQWWGAAGDGSWSVGSTFVGGTGRLGAAMVVGSIVGSSIAKSRARSKATGDAAIRWRPVDRGTVHITSHAFYLTDGMHGHRSYGWDSLNQIDVVEPGAVQFTGTTDQGTQTWLLASPWAELVFAYWILARRHPHPQWIDGSWFPYDTMRERSSYYGYGMPHLPQLPQ